MKTKSIREQSCGDHMLESLLEMLEPPTVKPLTNHIVKQICTVSMLALVFGNKHTVTIVPELNEDGLVCGFTLKMDGSEDLEKLADMSPEEVIAKIAPQLAENIRKEAPMSGLGDFLDKVFSGIQAGEDKENADQEQDATAAPTENPDRDVETGNAPADAFTAAQATDSPQTDGTKADDSDNVAQRNASAA